MSVWKLMSMASETCEYIARDENYVVRETVYHEGSWCYEIRSEFEWMSENTYLVEWFPVEFIGSDIKAEREERILQSRMQHFQYNLSIAEQALHSDDPFWKKFISLKDRGG